MIVIEKNTEVVDIPKGLGYVAVNPVEGGITPEEAREIAEEVVESALTDYETSEEIDQRFAEESARTEDAYAKKSELEGFATEDYVNSAVSEAKEWVEENYQSKEEFESWKSEDYEPAISEIQSGLTQAGEDIQDINERMSGLTTSGEVQDIVTSALSAYTKTEDFATINGSAITEGGEIVIEGGSGDYMVVDSLEDIEEPYEGLKAFVRAKYQTFQANVLQASAVTEGYAGRFYHNGQEKNGVYRSGENFHWDWTTDGKWNTRESDGDIIRYKAEHNGTFSAVLPDSTWELRAEQGVPSAVTTVTLIVEEDKEYTYFEEFGWIQRNIVLEEGGTYPELMPFLLSNRTELVVNNGLAIYGSGRKRIITMINPEERRFFSYSDGRFFMEFSMNENGYINSPNSQQLVNVDNNVKEETNGSRGGDFYYYNVTTDGQYWAEEKGEWFVGNLPNSFKLKIRLAATQGAEGGTRVRAYVIDENGSEIASWERYNWDGNKIWDFNDRGAEYHFILKVTANDEGSNGVKLYSTLELHAEDNLVDALSEENIFIEDNGLIHIDTIPSLLRNIQTNKEIIQYDKNDIQEFAGEILTAYTPTARFATINGSGITNGGNIVIQGGSGKPLYVLNDMTQAERSTLHHEISGLTDAEIVENYDIRYRYPMGMNSDNNFVTLNSIARYNNQRVFRGECYAMDGGGNGSFTYLFLISLQGNGAIGEGIDKYANTLCVDINQSTSAITYNDNIYNGYFERITGGNCPVSVALSGVFVAQGKLSKENNTNYLYCDFTIDGIEYEAKWQLQKNATPIYWRAKNNVTSSYIRNIWKGTQEQYEELGTYSETTFYIILEN